MIDPDRVNRIAGTILTPQVIIAQKLAGSLYPSPHWMKRSLELIEALVEHGYTIEPIGGEDDD